MSDLRGVPLSRYAGSWFCERELSFANSVQMPPISACRSSTTTPRPSARSLRAAPMPFSPPPTMMTGAVALVVVAAAAALLVVCYVTTRSRTQAEVLV